MTGAYHPRRVGKEVARSRKLPITGKLSARPAGKPGDFLIAKENLQRSFPATFFLQFHIILSAQYAFSRHGGIYRSDVVQNENQIPGRGRPPPDGRTRAQAKERVGRTTPFSSSAMSSAPAIP
jgi:hypothetical protein